MNEARQRLVPAILLTITLHGALLSWRMQQPQPLRPKPLPQKISVSLKRLAPPLPPMQEIVQEEHQPIRPVMPKAKPEPLQKIVQKVPALPKIAPVQHHAVRPLQLKPGKKIATALPSLPKLAPVIRQTIKPLAVQPVKRPEPSRVQTSVRPRQQPVLRRTITSRQTHQQPVRSHPIRRPPVSRTRQVVSSTPIRPMPRTAPANTGVVREAAPSIRPIHRRNTPAWREGAGLKGWSCLRPGLMQRAGSVHCSSWPAAAMPFLIRRP